MAENHRSDTDTIKFDKICKIKGKQPNKLYTRDNYISGSPAKLLNILICNKLRKYEIQMNKIHMSIIAITQLRI